MVFDIVVRMIQLWGVDAVCRFLSPHCQSSGTYVRQNEGHHSNYPTTPPNVVICQSIKQEKNFLRSDEDFF